MVSEETRNCVADEPKQIKEKGERRKEKGERRKEKGENHPDGVVLCSLYSILCTLNKVL